MALSAPRGDDPQGETSREGTSLRVRCDFRAWESKTEGESKDSETLQKADPDCSHHILGYGGNVGKESLITVNILLEWVEDGGRGTANSNVEILEEL